MRQYLENLDKNEFAQASKCRTGADISYTNGIYSVVNQANIHEWARGLELFSTGATGNIALHLVGNNDSSGAKIYTVHEIRSGEKLGIIFDEIKQTGTTVTLLDSKLVIYL